MLDYDDIKNNLIFRVDVEPLRLIHTFTTINFLENFDSATGWNTTCYPFTGRTF